MELYGVSGDSRKMRLFLSLTSVATGVGQHLGFGGGESGQAFLRDFELEGPGESVEHEFPKVVVVPVLVVVATGESETAPSVFPLECPHQGFFASIVGEDVFELSSGPIGVSAGMVVGFTF